METDVKPIGPEPRDTERRRITVMFADITGFTTLVQESSPEHAYEVVTGCLTRIDGIARRHGASVDKYLGDCVMAVFGIPTVLEDAPRAAVNAAIEMLEAVRDYSRERALSAPLELHVGINTGLAISGDVSGPILREFAVMGDSVNVASRLKDQAPPGHVYVGPDTFRYTRDSFEYRPVAPLELKGRKGSLQAYDLVSERTQLYRQRGRAEHSILSELVGREAELGCLLAALRAVQAGEGRIVSVSADAGLGKSRLIDEFLRTPLASTARCLIGRSTVTGRKLSYHPFADLLRRWARIEDEDPEEVARAALAEAVSEIALEDGERARAVLARLMGVPPTPEEQELLAAITGSTGAVRPDEAMETTILRVMRAVLERLAAAGPLVVVLEDLHWADISSIGLLEGLLPLTGALPILFVLAERPGFDQTSGHVLETADREHAGRHLRLALQALSQGDTRRLLRNLFGGGRIPPEFLARLEQKAGGNPFFVEEVVRGLLAQGALSRSELGLEATPQLVDAELPDTIHEVILARIDRLPRDLKHLLQLAAVLGRRFHFDVIQAMHGGGLELSAQLGELGDHQLIETSDLQGGAFSFVHPLSQQVAYDSILETKRAELHLAAARAIEAHMSESLPGYHGMLAYHFGLGRDLVRAEAYLHRAGEEATQLAAADEALAFFEEAARLYLVLHGEGGDPERKAELERNIARAHANRGDMVDAIEHTDRALRLLGDSVPSGRLARARAGALGALTALRALYLPPRRGRQAATPRESKIIKLRFDRARAQTTADPTGFVIDSLQTFRTIWAVDPRSVEGVGGMAAGLVGPIAFMGISLALGRRIFELARGLASDRPPERFLVEFMGFLHHFLAGDWADDREIDPGLTEEVLNLGVIWDVTNYLGLLVEKKTFEGAFGEANRWLGELKGIADAYRYDLARSTHRAQTTFLLLEQGRLHEAREAADLYYTQHPEQLLSLLALGARAKARALEGDLDGAATDLEAAERILELPGPVPPYHSSSVCRSRLLVDVARLDRARAAGRGAELRRARGAARRSSRRARGSVRAFAARRPEVFRLEGSRRWLSGDRRGARRWWERSLAEAKRLGARPEWARTQLEIATRLTQDGKTAEAREPLVAAEAVFAELGLAWDLEGVGLLGIDLSAGPPALD